MTDSAMILHESNGSAMSAYQDRDDVRELGDRLLAMHPAAAEVGPATCQQCGREFTTVQALNAHRRFCATAE